MPAKLSVCLIVRDEADVLPRCLASVAGIADEIVAVDTGSTDGSQEILRRFGATVVEMPWPEDFGAARTESVRHATGDWVLCLDADEALDRATAQNLRLLMVDLDEPVSFEVPILSYLEDDETGETTLSWMPRLFNQPGEHYFYGRIHEQLIGSTPVRLDTSIVNLKHWGYQPSRVTKRDKDRRNEALLRGEDTDTLRSALYLAAAAASATETIELSTKAVDLLQPQTPAAVQVSVVTMLLKAYNRLEQWDMTLSEGALLLERFPTMDTEAQYWLLVGDAHRGKGDAEAAETAYRRAFGLVTDNRVLQSYWNEQVPASAALNLAGMLVRRQAYAEARDVLEETVRLPRLSRKSAAKLQGALANTYAATSAPTAAWEAAQTSLASLPELRTIIANSFIEHDEPLLAIRVMAPALDPLILRDRVTTMAASLLGDRRAVDLLEWLLSEDEDGPVRVNLGLHWLALDEPDKARTAIAQGLAETEDSAAVELRLAYFEQVLGRIEAADVRLAATVQAAAEAGNEGWLAESLTQWGNLAFQTGQWDKAAAILTEALALRPQDPYLHYALASAHYGQGDLEATRSGYERALMLDPSFAPAHQGLNALQAATAAGGA